MKKAFYFSNDQNHNNHSRKSLKKISAHFQLYYALFTDFILVQTLNNFNANLSIINIFYFSLLNHPSQFIVAKRFEFKVKSSLRIKI